MRKNKKADIAWYYIVAAVLALLILLVLLFIIKGTKGGFNDILNIFKGYA